jgi:hypothetical protein
VTGLPGVSVARRWSRVLALGTLVLFALRALLSLARSGPVITADEVGYLVNARVIAGGIPADMGSSPFYRGGYSLVIAPILQLGGDPRTLYGMVLLANAALAASLVPLLYLLLTRSFDVPRRLAAWAAVAAAAYPTVTALSQVAMSENVLFPLMAAWVLAAGSFLRTGALPWALAAGVTAAALETVHGRMIGVVALTLVVVGVTVARSRDRLVAGLAGAVAAGAGVVAGRELNGHLSDVNWRGRAADEIGTALPRLLDPATLVEVGRNLIGQTWYLVVATLGLVLVVIVLDAVPAMRRVVRRCGVPRDDSVLLLMATAAVLVAPPRSGSSL